MAYGKYLTCGTCGNSIHENRVSDEQKKKLNRKRWKLVGLLYGGYAVLLTFSAMASLILASILIGVGLLASFVGLVAFVVTHWDMV